jgi:hypothetical protein
VPDRRVRRRGRPQPPLAGGAVVSVATESVDANTGETWSVPPPQALIWGSAGTTTYEVSFGGVISTCDATEQPVAPEMIRWVGLARERGLIPPYERKKRSSD